MQIKLDFRSGVPIYVQIMEQIKNQIATGDLQPGDQLPTVRQLAADLRVNFNTVARAYRTLDEAGLISTQHGRGTYILAPLNPENAALVRREALESVTRHYLAEAARLDYSPEEVVREFEKQLQCWQGEEPPDHELAEDQ